MNVSGRSAEVTDEMSDDKQHVDAKQVDTYFEKKPAENKPHKILIGQNAFSTFDDATVEDVEEGAVVSFEFVTNGRYNNIVDGSLEIVEDSDGDSGGADQRDAGVAGPSPTDARIRRQVALKAAVEHHKDGPAAPEDVTATASTFDDWLQGGGA